MAKFYSNGIKKGKLGSSVFRMRHGECIEAAYNPSVSNPQTAKQVEARAKLKLISQLSAALAPAIAIRRIGNISPRNQFTKMNIELCGYAGNIANINLNRVQLTKGVVGLPAFTADRSDNTKIALALEESAASAFDKVVYVAAKKQADDSILMLGSVVADAAGEDGTFPAELAYTADSVVVYAYGIRSNNDRARTIFGNMQAPNAEQIAKLIVNRTLSEYDVTLSATNGLTMNEGEDSGSSESFEGATITLRAQGSGTVSGAGYYRLGSQRTVYARPGENAVFEGWHLGTAAGTRVSTDATYTFELTEDITLVAVFTGAPVTLTVQTNDQSMGTVTGGTTAQAGTQVTVQATPAAGHRFVNWKNGNTVVSTDATYTFTLEANTTLLATFEEVQGGTLTLDARWMTGNVDVSSSAQLTGAGTYAPGTQVQVSCAADMDWSGETIGFTAWKLGSTSGEVVSTNRQFSYTVNGDATLVACYSD